MELAKLDVVLKEVGRDKNLDPPVLINALEQAILTAAQRPFGMNLWRALWRAFLPPHESGISIGRGSRLRFIPRGVDKTPWLGLLVWYSRSSLNLSQVGGLLWAI